MYKNLLFEKKCFSLKTIILTALLGLFGSGVFAQNALNSGDFSTGSWGSAQSMASSSGGSLILTKQVSTSRDKFFRFYGDGSPCGEYQSNAGGDFFTHSTVVTSPNGNCGSSNAWRVNVPTTSSNVVFKTDGNNTGISQSIVFVVQGTVQTVSTVTQLPLAANVQPGQAVTVTAGLSGALSTGQAVYMRYTNDNFTSSTVIQLSGSGSTYTGTIPATINLSAALLKYYIFTSTDAGVGAGAAQVRADGSNADFYTINLNNNANSNYIYTVATAVAIYNHDFGATTITTHPYTVAPATFDANLNTSSWSNSPTAAWTSFAGSAGQAITIQPENGVATAITLTFNIASGYQVSISSYNLWRQRSSTNGPNISSMTINGTNVYGGSTSPTTGAAIGVTNVTNPIANLTGTITVVLNLSATLAAGSNLRLDEFTLNGTVSLIPTTPPSVTSFAVAAPGSGSSGYVGNTVTVTGSGFTGVSQVRVGGAGGTIVSSFTVANDTTITFPAINASGPIYVINGSGNSTSAGSYTNLGFITTTGATNWNTAASWLGGAVPIANSVTTIAHAINIAAALTNTPISSITINTGITATANATVAIGTVTNAITTSGTGVFTFSGASGSIIAGSFTNAGTLSWFAAAALNISAGGTLTNNGTFTRGTGTVNFVGAGTVNGSAVITFNNLTINAGALTLGTGTTVDGIFQVNGGNVNNAGASPIYTANSTLNYNVTYSRFAEWSATGVGTIGTTPGYPNNVTINTGTFTVVNSDAGIARAMNGNLLVNNGTTFTLGTLNANFTVNGNLTTSGTGAVNMSNSSNRMTVGGSVTIAATGALALSSASGGDLYLNGNITNNGTFTHNARAIFFTGSASQTISGSFNTAGAINNIPVVIVNNANNVVLGAALLVSNDLTFTSGRITLGTNNLTVNGSITTPTASSYVNNNSTGRLIQNVGAGNVFYPVGKTTYNPITLNNTGGTIDNYGVYVLDVTTTPVTNDATKLVNRFWNISEAVASGTNLNVTAQWNGASEQNTNFAAGTTPRIALFTASWADQTATLGSGTVGGSSTYATTAVFTPSDITTGATIGLGKDDAFVFPPPTVTSFTPTSAYTGTIVTITGTNFIGATAVSFGGTAATSFVVVSANTITAVVSTGTNGSALVISGTGSGSLAGFTYLGYISNADGSWSTGATWLGGNTPPNNSVITIANAVNLVGSNPTQTSVTVNATRSLNSNGAGNIIVTGAITNNGTVAFSSTGNITAALFTNSATGALTWTAGTATLNIGTGGTLTNNNVFTRGTGTVNFAGVGTISGTINFHNLTVNGSLDIGSATTINNNLTLNASSFINTGNPTYTTSSTLTYNTGASYSRGNEWTGASSGAGFPHNVRISTVGTNVSMNAGTASCGGNVVVDLSTTFNTAAVALNIAGSLTSNGTISLGGDIYISGANWTIGATGSQSNNDKAVFFNAASINQIITRTGGGNVFFDYFVINKAAGNVVIEAATNIVINSTTGDVLQIINAGQLDLNSRSLTLNGNGGNILVTGGARNISGVANSAVNINGAKTVSGTGSLVLGSTVTIALTNGFNCGSGNKTTINGMLQINLGGFINTNAPIYGSAAILKYNSNTVFNRDIEWNRNIGGSFGVPNNVQISNNTTLNYPFGSPTALGMTGNLIIDAGSSMYMDYSSVSAGGALTINGNLTSAGNLTLGFAPGDNLKIGGNIIFNTGFTFDAKNRDILFTKNGTQTISGTGGTPTFHYVLQAPTSGTNTIQLSGMDLNIAAPIAGNSIDFGSAANVLDMNGRTLTLGTVGVANSIIGSNGTFKGSTTSNLVLLGNGSVGTLRFTISFQSLGTLTLNRQAGNIGAVLGSALSINSVLNLNNGLLDLSTFNLTLASAATIGGSPSNNSFIIADNTGELRKTYTANGSFTFPIGDNTGTAEYSPATLNFTAGSYLSAYAALKVTDAKHLSNIATTDFLTRFWSVTSFGISTPTYNFTGTYIGTASDISGTEANSKPGRWDGTDWLDESLTSISANTLSLIGLTTLPTTNQFTAGAPLTDATYYYRSAINNGSWNIAANWQSSPNGSSGWVTATTPPNIRAASIVIRSGFNINANSSVTADDTIVDSGATLTISAGTFTLNNGVAATDLTVNGTLTYSGGTFTQNASSGIAFAANATYNHAIAASSLTLPIATWDVTSNCNVTGLNNSSIFSGGVTMGQTFGNFTFDNTNQTTYINIENNNFRVNGTMTVGPNATTQRVSFTNTGTNSNTINRIVVSSGQLNAAGSGNETLTITNDVSVTDGFFIISMGSGTANVDIGTDLSISGNGTVQVLGIASSPSQTLRIRRDLLISGSTPTLDLEAVNTTNGLAIITVDRDFISNSSSITFPAVDFGSATSNVGNIINIGRNFNKSNAGFFQTFSSSSATGFAFNGTGSQTFSYSGQNSSFTSYVIRNGATLLLDTNLTLGTGTNPPSFFTVDNGGTLNFQTNSIIAGNTADPRFLASDGANLITANTSGLGGTAALGSLRSFGNVGTALSAGRAAFVAGHNLTFNGATTTPFASANNTNFGTPARVNVNADLTSNMTTNTIVTTAFNVNNGGIFKLNPTNNNGLNLSTTAALTIATGGTFDNGGENSVTNGGSIAISGRFITQDVQGFVGTNTSIPAITPTLNAGSTIEYGLAGNQAVQGSTAPTYQNITFSNGGTKTLISLNPVIGTISVLGTTIFDAGNNAFGSGTSNVTMTGASIYRLGGTTASKPESGGTYTLAAGSTFEFTGNSNTDIRLSGPTITFANIIISGTSVFNPGTATGIRFQTNGTFTVRNGGIFKLKNTNGFTGSASTAINTVLNGGPTITLESGSRVEFAGDQTLPATQTITPFATYSDVGISGTGTKVILSSSEVLVGRDLILSPFSTPSQTGTLQIDNAKLLTVSRNILNTSTKDLVIMNGGNLVQITDVDNATANANSGNIKMTRSSRSMFIDDYVYWGSPVKENVFSQTPSAYSVSYMWNLNCPGTVDGFWDYTSTTIPGRGFITRVDGGGEGIQNFTFTGTPNNGTVKVQACNYDTTSLVTGNTILLANPYPSAIGCAELLTNATNVGKMGGTLYFWTASTPYNATTNSYTTNDYASWNLTGGVGTTPISNPSATALLPNGKISAGQGFFAQVFDNFDVVFKNSMRQRNITSNSQFFKSNLDEVDENDKNRIWLNLYDANQFRQMLIGYVPMATNDFERLFDGDTFTSNNINIYSIVTDRSLVIQGRALPFSETDLVPLGIKITEAGTYSIAIDRTDGLFLGDQDIFLDDLNLNIIHDLKASSYSFLSESGTFNNRFVLRYTNTTLSIPNFNIENTVLVYKEKNALKINSSLENIEKVVVFDVLGRKIFEVADVKSKNFIKENLNASQQTLIVKIKLSNGTTISKKIIF